MAHQEEEYTPGMHHDFGMTPTTWWLAGLAGAGVLLMLIAAGVGVITGQNVGLLFALGVILFIAGVVAWAAVTRPFDHIDDIDVPIDGPPHHEEPNAELASSEQDDHPAAPSHH